MEVGSLVPSRLFSWSSPFLRDAQSLIKRTHRFHDIRAGMANGESELGYQQLYV